MTIKPIKIGNKYVVPGKPCFFVSEIGINHNGDISLAKKILEWKPQISIDQGLKLTINYFSKNC